MLVFYTVLITLVFAIIGYLFGNILFGDIFSFFLRKNVRLVGSGNVGGMNSMRTFGKWYGLTVMLLDGIKSYSAVICCWCIFLFSIKIWFPNHSMYCLIYIGGLFTTIGHCFPIKYLIHIKEKDKTKWIGGKGMMTTAGAIAAISPYLAAITFTIWVIVVIISRYASLASILCTLIAPFFIFIKQLDLMYLFGNNLFNNSLNFISDSEYSQHLMLFISLFIIIFLSSLFVLYRHKSNLIRIKQDTERKIFNKESYEKTNI